MKSWTKREVVAYLDRVEPALERLNYFELLDVDAMATPQRVRQAFHQMAARMHPDRHRGQLSPADYERLTIVYARIAEAYRVLREEGSRSSYLMKLASRKAAGKTNDIAPPEAASEDSLAMLGAKAQRLYRRAQAALRTGDRSSAILSLRMALAKHPSSSFLRDALAAAEKNQD